MKSLPLLNCPKSVRIFSDRFKDLLSANQNNAFVACLFGWILGVCGLSDIFRYVLFSPSVSTLGRFLDMDKDLRSKLCRRQRRTVAKFLKLSHRNPSRFLFAIDDTLVERSGRGEKTWGAYWWHDHKTSGQVFGHKLLVLGIVDTKKHVLIPLVWEVLHQEIEGYPHEKGWEVALRFIDVIIADGFPKLTIVFDSWFNGDEFCSALTDKGFDYVSEMKSNRKLMSFGKNRKVNDRIDNLFKPKLKNSIYFGKKKSWASEAVVTLKPQQTLKKDKPFKTLKVKAIAVSSKKSLDDEPFAYYVSNRLTWNASKIWGISRSRWTIEVSFRELKEFFTLGEAAVRNQNSIDTSIVLSMFALTVVRIEQYIDSPANDDQHSKLIPACVIVQKMKLNSFDKVISRLVPNNKGTSVTLAKISSRINQENLRKKPLEKNSHLKRLTGNQCA